MKIICVDDEELLVEDAVATCLELPQIDEAIGFSNPDDALTWLKKHPTDLALLDIDMPSMNGIELAAKIKTLRPEVSVIFLTGYSQYALDAFNVHASGYLLKPMTKERLAEEIAYVASSRPIKSSKRVVVQTFGNFDVFVDDKLVTFKMARCKELIAYLIDKQGSSVTRAEAFATLWEDRIYDRPMQKQFDGVIRAMRDTLKQYGIEDIFELKNGTMRIIPSKFSCDSYLFFQGDTDAVNAFRGEYMSAYSWASITEGYMTWKKWNR